MNSPTLARPVATPTDKPCPRESTGPQDFASGKRPTLPRRPTPKRGPIGR